MNRFDAQTLVGSVAKDKTSEMIFEDAKGNRLTLSMPSQVAPALIPVLEKLKTTAVGAYATMAQEFRTARDNDSPHVLLEIKGHETFVFSLNGAKALSEQVRNHCEEIERRSKRLDS